MTYRDSTGVPEWTLKRRLQDDGYLLIRDFISDDVLDKARRVVIETVERHGWGTWDARIRKLRGRPDIWDVLEPDAYNDALRAIWTHPDVYLLAHAPELMGLMRLLLGDEPFVHPLKVMRLMFPAAESTQWPARHQDFPELQGAPEQLTAWLTLFPVEPAGGALPVWPGSHRHGVLPLDLSLHPSGWEAMLPDGREPVVGNLEPGDVLVFTTYTVHGAARG